nr:hypothetical protein [Tanacetum cinerariifolium]
MPPKPDLVLNTAPTAVETGHSTFNVQLSTTKPEQDLSHTNRPTAPIIKDWVSNSEDDSETKAPQIVPSFLLRNLSNFNIHKWYQSLVFWNFKLEDTTKEELLTQKEEMELEIAETTTDDVGTSIKLIPGPVTIEKKAKKKNDKQDFGRNEAIKKTQKTLLKQLYENFSATGTDSFDLIFNKLQKLVSQLAVLVSIANLSDATMYAFLANQPNGSQLVHEDLEQIHEDDLEEMDLKWQLALLSMRAKRNQETTRRTVNMEDPSSKAMVAIDRAIFDWSFMTDDEAPTNMAFMALLESELYTDNTCSKTCLKNYATLKTQYDELKVEFNKSKCNLANYKRGLASVEEQLVHYQTNKSLLNENIIVLKRDIKIKDPEIVVLKSKLEKISNEKDALETKIEKFENASQSLDKLIGSQVTDNSKKGLGYVNYNVVPPPHTGRFSPLRINLSHTSLPVFVKLSVQSYGVKPIGVVTQKSSVKIFAPIKENNGAPLIEDCESDEEDEVESPSELGVNTIRGKGWPVNPKRNFQRRAAYNNKNFFKKVNTAKEKVNTARPNSAVLNVIRANKGKAIKALAYVAFGRGAKGCKITNKGTIRTDHLVKFDGKSDEGFFVGYFTNSKAFRVYNTRTRKVEENLHIKFLENKPLIKDSDGDNQDNDGSNTKSGIYNQKRPNDENSTKDINIARPSINTASSNINIASPTVNTVRLSDDSFGADNDMRIFDGVELDISNISATYPMFTTPNIRINKDHSLNNVIGDIQSGGCTEEGCIYYDEVFTPAARIEAIRLFLAYASFIGFLVYQMDVKSAFLGKIDPTLFIKRIKEDIILVQVYVEDIIFRSTKKELCTEFEKSDGIFIRHDRYVDKILRKFKYEDVKSAITPIDKEKALLKDLDGDEVGVHLYRKTRTRIGKMDIRIPQSNVPSSAIDEAITKEILDGLGRATTTVSSLEVEQGSDEDRAVLPHDRLFTLGVKFNIHKDAKTLVEAIEKWFGGNKETKKIDANDLEEINLKWKMAMLTVRARKGHFARECSYDWSFQAEEEPTNYALMTFTSSSSSSSYNERMAQATARNHAKRGNHQHSTRIMLPNPQRHVAPTVLLTQSKLVPIIAVRPVTTVFPKTNVTKPRQAKTIITKPHSPPGRHINYSPSPKVHNFPLKITAAKAPMGNPHHALKDKGVIDSGCSRHMTVNMSYLSDFKALNRGYVAFGGNSKGGKIFGKEADFNNLETSITVSHIPTTRVHKDHLVTQIMMTTIHVCLHAFFHKKNPRGAIGTKWVFRNKKNEKGIVVRNKAQLVAQGHTQEEGINYEEVFAPVARIEAIRLFLAYASFMGFMVYQMDVKSAFLYETIKEKKPNGIFISQDKYVAEILRKFGLTDGKSASILIDTKKPLLKDSDGEDVDVHIYRSMIGSLMYLTSSRPDIMFAQIVVATSSTEVEYVATASCCAQVLQIQNQLLDYGYNFMHTIIDIDNSSTIWQMAAGKENSNPFMADASEGFNQIIDFLNENSIKCALIVNPNIYVSCIKQFWTSVPVKKVNDVTRLQALVDKKKVIITKATIRDALRLNDADGIDCLPNEEIFTKLARMGYEKPSTKLTFYKAFFSSQ